MKIVLHFCGLPHKCGVHYLCERAGAPQVAGPSRVHLRDQEGWRWPYRGVAQRPAFGTAHARQPQGAGQRAGEQNLQGLGTKMIAYKIKLEPDDNETLLVTCPDLPPVTTFGEDRADALAHAVDAIEGMIASYMAHGEDVPRPRPV